jgi:hypothetical protein
MKYLNLERHIFFGPSWNNLMDSHSSKVFDRGIRKIDQEIATLLRDLLKAKYRQ